MKKLLALAVVILGFTAVSFGQLKIVSEAAKASATILTPVSIVKNTDLNFGNIVNATGGTVVLGTDDSRVASAGLSLPAFKGTVSAAAFTITGESGSTYSISNPASIIIKNGVNEMTVNTFTSAAAAGTLGTLTGTIGTTTTQQVLFGGTLTVLGTQAAGVYSNDTEFKITVNYN